MKTANVHSVSLGQAIKPYRKIPYDAVSAQLKSEQRVFIEGPIGRTTIWKASRKLSQMLGRTVVAERYYLRVGKEKTEAPKVLEGYLLRFG